jgi:hypothetical protein
MEIVDVPVLVYYCAHNCSSCAGEKMKPTYGGHSPHLLLSIGLYRSRLPCILSNNAWKITNSSCNLVFQMFSVTVWRMMVALNLSRRTPGFLLNPRADLKRDDSCHYCKTEKSEIQNIWCVYIKQTGYRMCCCRAVRRCLLRYITDLRDAHTMERLFVRVRVILVV